MVIGIDPSYTSTGVAVMDNGKVVYTTKIESKIKVYESITNCQKAAATIIRGLQQVIAKYPLAEVIVEYPAIQSSGGAILGILHGYLASFLNSTMHSVTYVPPTACDSWCKNKLHSKSFLVQYVKERGYVQKRIQQDIATAIILCELHNAIQEGKYKNKSFRYE